MNIESLYWNEPLWLLLALQPLVFFLLRWIKKQKQINNYANPKLQRWVLIPRTSSWKNYLLNRNSIYFTAWFCIAIAAAGPRVIEEIPNTADSLGVDIMVVVDISRSMHVQDVSPNRLGRAKQKIQSLLPLLQNDRLGLVVYAAHAHQYMPLSYDKDIIQHYLQNLDSLSPPTQGSRPLTALKFAEQLLDTQAHNKKNKAILLITDGEGFEIAPKMNTSVFVLGIGSVEGDAIPGYNGEWLRNNNRVIVSRLHETILNDVANINAGQYSRSNKGSGDLEHLYTNGIKLIREQYNIEINDKVIWRELYTYALLPAILLLIISSLSFNGLTNSSFSRENRSRISGDVIVLILCLIFVSDINYAQAGNQISAYHAFGKENYVLALEEYRRIDGYHGRFGEAASAYRLKDYAHAISAFKESFLNAENEQQRSLALYNLGNSHFQNGNYAEAIKSYKDSLIYNPSRTSTQQNMVFSTKLHKTVQQRLARINTLLRPGKGPKQAAVDENTIISDDASISVDESNDVLENGINSEMNFSTILGEKLILKGLEHAKLASEESLSINQVSIHEKKYARSISQQRVNDVTDQQALFWNRILEIEEGFPARLDEPRTIKGIAAW